MRKIESSFATFWILFNTPLLDKNKQFTSFDILTYHFKKLSNAGDNSYRNCSVTRRKESDERERERRETEGWTQQYAQLIEQNYRANNCFILANGSYDRSQPTSATPPAVVASLGSLAEMLRNRVACAAETVAARERRNIRIAAIIVIN